MERVTTINNIPMIKNGDYYWEILKENDGSEVYKIVLNGERDIILMYGENTFSIRYFHTFFSGDGDIFFFSMPFSETHKMIDSLLVGEKCTVGPIYHKNTIKIK